MNLNFGFAQHPSPLVHDTEVEMDLRPVGKAGRRLQRLRGSHKIPKLQACQAEIEQQVEDAKPQSNCAFVFLNLLASLSHHSIGETQVIVSKRTVWIAPEYFQVEANRFGIVFGSQEVVG